ncbi:MAG: hypothetical protein IK128_04840 [Clostridiales bacterium]|nr:hypothetical protein [Clostridiales bacterium]
MIEKLLRDGSNEVEMNVVCSDFSLLENINGMLSHNGVIGVRDGVGKIHYIVDGRRDRLGATHTVTTLIQSPGGSQREEYYDVCAKSVFLQYGMNFAHTGTVILYDSIKKTIYQGEEVPINMKTVYMDAASRTLLTFDQIERDVRYAIKRSALSGGGSKSAYRTLVAAIKRRIISGGEK